MAEIKINERHAVKEDDKINLSLTIIPKDEVPLLLTYLASHELHEMGIKGEIVDFLKKNNAVLFDEAGKPDMESYTYGSIYFRMKGDYNYTTFKTLNASFEEFIKPFEATAPGKMFWSFQYLTCFNMTNGTKTIARAGYGNKPFNDDFQAQITLLLKS